MPNYISFSLFGTEPLYTSGLLTNLKIAPSLYPDWTAVVFVDDQVSQATIRQIGDLGGLVVRPSIEFARDKRTWRFGAVLFENAEAVIFRDADSRISERERASVHQWIISGKDLHVMRDHPFHSWWIMAGMWGVRAESAKDGVKRVLSNSKGETVNEDQDLLAREVYRSLAGSSVIHDSFFRRESWSLPFPSPRKDGQFVGERISSEEEPEPEMRKILTRYEDSKFWQSRLLMRDYLRTRFEQKLEP